MEGKERRCQCCGNTIKYTSGINAYWLEGNKFIYYICPECQSRPSRQKIFLRSVNDVIGEVA